MKRDPRLDALIRKTQRAAEARTTSLADQRTEVLKVLRTKAQLRKHEGRQYYQLTAPNSTNPAEGYYVEISGSGYIEVESDGGVRSVTEEELIDRMGGEAKFLAYLTKVRTAPPLRSGPQGETVSAAHQRYVDHPALPPRQPKGHSKPRKTRTPKRA